MYTYTHTGMLVATAIDRSLYAASRYGMIVVEYTSSNDIGN